MPIPPPIDPRQLAAEIESSVSEFNRLAALAGTADGGWPKQAASKSGFANSRSTKLRSSPIRRVRTASGKPAAKKSCAPW